MMDGFVFNHWCHLERMKTLIALGHLEADFLPAAQGAVAVALNLGIMHEQVFALFRRDKTVTLGVVEPLDDADAHANLLLSTIACFRTAPLSL